MAAAGLDWKGDTGASDEPDVIALAPRAEWEDQHRTWRDGVRLVVGSRLAPPGWNRYSNMGKLTTQARAWIKSASSAAAHILSRFEQLNDLNLTPAWKRDSDTTAWRFVVRDIAIPDVLRFSNYVDFHRTARDIVAEQDATNEQIRMMWDNEWAMKSADVGDNIMVYNPPPFLIGWLLLLREGAHYGTGATRRVLVHDRLVECATAVDDPYIPFLGHATDGIGAARLYIPAGGTAMRIELDMHDARVANAAQFVRFMLVYMNRNRGMSTYLQRPLNQYGSDDDDAAPVAKRSHKGGGQGELFSSTRRS